MSTIDRDALLKWLGEQYYREDISHDRARAFLAVKREIESGRFDAPNEAEERYRESIEVDYKGDICINIFEEATDHE
jgi:hypothetical protein